jgi:hypothetical protein
MMSSVRKHHAAAEQLLGQAGTEEDSIRRSLILAEAQVHATLALSAVIGTARPGPGRGQAGGIRRTGARPLGTPAQTVITGPPTAPSRYGGTLHGWGSTSTEPHPGPSSEPSPDPDPGQAPLQQRAEIIAPADEEPARPAEQPLTFNPAQEDASRGQERPSPG